MASANHLTFKIGSTFDGEGFKQARNATKDISTKVKGATGMMQELGRAMGNASGAATGAAKAITGIVGAVASMGVVAGSVAVATQLLNSVFDKQIEKLKECMAGWEALRQANRDRFIASITGDVSALTREVTQLTANFDQTTKSAVAFSNALNGLNSADRAGAIGQLQVDKLQEILDAHTEAERQAIEISYALKEAELRKTQIVDVANEKLASVNAAYDAVQEKLALNASAQTKANAALERASYSFDVVSQNYEVGSAEYKAAEAEMIAAKKLVTQLDNEQTQLIATSKELTLQQQTAIQEKTNAETEGTKILLEAQVKAKEYGEAEFEREQAKAKERSEQVALFLKNNEVVEEGIEKQKELNAALDERVTALHDLIAAEKNYQAALGEYADASAVSTKNTGIGDGIYGQMKSGALPVKVVNTQSMQVADARVDEAIRNGTVNTVKDADKMRRQEARNQRDQMNKDSGQRAQEAQKYERLLKQNADSLSKQDKDFMAEYEKIRAAAEAQRKAVEDAKEKTAESAKAIKEIKDQLKNLTAS